MEIINGFIQSAEGPVKMIGGYIEMVDGSVGLADEVRENVQGFFENNPRGMGISVPSAQEWPNFFVVFKNP